MPTRQFEARRWYFIIGGDNSRAWSTQAMAYVSTSDNVYTSWVAWGGAPMQIDSELSLSNYLDSLAGSSALNLSQPFWYIGPIVLPKYIDREAYRRISSGFIFRGKCIQMRDELIDGVQKNDQINICAQAVLANAAIARGAIPGDLNWCQDINPFVWRAADNSMLPIDAFGMMELSEAAARWKRENIWAASYLKDMSPIPRDFANNDYWPQ